VTEVSVAPLPQAVVGVLGVAPSHPWPDEVPPGLDLIGQHPEVVHQVALGEVE
jgi:hypothetical protein